MTQRDLNQSSFDVFVSYSSKDKAIADAVVAAVEGEGIRCWYAPRDIEPGADWADSITRAIQECSLMVLVFSEKANRSQRVIDEINFAIDQRKPILPFRIEAYNPTGALSLHLSSRHWLDAYEPSWDAHLDRLVESVTANLGSERENVQISGGAASAKVERGQEKKQTPKIAIYLLAGLILVSVAGYFGWQNFGGSPAPTSSPVVTEAASLQEQTPIPTSNQATTEVSDLASDRDAVLNSLVPEREEGFILDPQLNVGAENQLAVTLNLFLTLTKYDPERSEVVPGAARSWTVSPDGMIYTFTLYPDIPWVTHELGGQTTQVTDADGDPRFLKAEDFIYAIRRMCDPRLMEFYFRPTEIRGCQDALDYGDVETIPEDVFTAIGVEAVSDTELIVQLNEPSGAFLTKTTHFFFSALPTWAMEKYGEAWTSPGLIPSNGPFVIDDWIPGERIRLVRNELLPEVLAGEGNLGSVELLITDGNPEEEYQLWQSNQVDYVVLRNTQYQEHFRDHQDETTELVEGLTVAYLRFDLTRPPFNDVHLRRAFSAALDRESLVNETLDGGIPMIHLAPPSAFGAPPVDEVGMGFDPEYAQAVLEEVGYPGCEGLPPLTFVTVYSNFDQYGDSIARSWEKNLGCPEGTIDYQGQIDYSEMSTYGWNILGLGWGSDFPDEDNWVGTVLSCEKPYIDRECSEVDTLIEQAREEYRPAERIQLYHQIEEDFFGRDGSFPVAPLYTKITYYATSSWVDMNVGQYAGMIDWTGIKIDMDAKEQALKE